MKILLVNKFFYLKGGAEYVFFETAELLKNKGHKTIFFSMEHPRNFPSEYRQYFVSNVDYEEGGLKNIIKSSVNLLYSFEAKNKIERLIEREKPDIAHLHNFVHQISPSIMHVFKKYRIPVVMTMHDYKLICASYYMLSRGRICELCKRQKYYNCFLQACVRGSRMKSLLNTIEMYLHHEVLHIYDLIDCFISPSKFLKEKIEQMGFKGRKIIILPNMLRIEDYFPKYGSESNSIIYFGRLSREKGLPVLLESAKGIKKINLKIMGEGPLRVSLEAKIKDEKIENVSFLGYKTGEQLNNEIRNSLFVVLPSQCYENNPRSIIEGFALGKPAIGARIGGIPELVIDGKTGLTFEPGNNRDLRSKIQYLLDNPHKIEEMGRNARDFVAQEFNTQKHYERLMKIYEMAMEKNRN